MIVRRFYDEGLAQASYLIGCAETGEAVVVDPNRDVDQYLDAAEAEGLRVTHVTETHIHADFVSGLRELAHRTGARIYLSAEGGEEWQYGFGDDEETGAAERVLLRDGDEFRVGHVRLRAVHTPGHTPEHLTFLVTDGAAADEHIAALTGDFLFVGDVGRPDLLEKAAGVAGTMEPGARQLFRSLRRFLETYPDWLQVWPGHGAGSACGKSIGAVPQSTIGYERRFNWALHYEDEDEFVRAVLEGQPEPPKYFAEMKRINRVGPRILNGLPVPERQAAQRLPAVLDVGEPVVDIRPARSFGAGHIPGTINIPLDRSFTTWAGWFIPYDSDFHLLADDERSVVEAVRALALIGLDRVAGWFDTGALNHWHESGRGDLQSVPRIGVDQLRPHLTSADFALVDVRGESEWLAGHLPGARNIPLGYLPDHLGELPRDRDVVVYCETGARSAIAVGLLQAAGFENVAHVKGGLAAVRAAATGAEAA
ncbi:MAG TPA: rhodanese-like domain-containing protein [Longimicrobiales bacterium]|nr:rhodanese-like domain-containing protein [Longimicrobiales bacterium]